MLFVIMTCSSVRLCVNTDMLSLLPQRPRAAAQISIEHWVSVGSHY